MRILLVFIPEWQGSLVGSEDTWKSQKITKVSNAQKMGLSVENSGKKVLKELEFLMLKTLKLDKQRIEA